MEKKFLVAALLVSLVLLSGCLKIEMREDIQANGMSTISMKIDMSNFPQQGEETNPCEGMETGEGPALQNLQCTYEDKVLALTGQFDRSNSTAFTKDGDNYRLDVKAALEEFNETSDESSQMPEDEQGMELLKSSGFEYSYYIKMPGTMVSQEGGEVQDDGYVKFDLLELDDGAYVESTTAGGFGMDAMLIFGGLVVLIAVVAILVMALKRR